MPSATHEYFIAPGTYTNHEYPYNEYFSVIQFSRELCKHKLNTIIFYHLKNRVIMITQTACTVASLQSLSPTAAATGQSVIV